MKKFLIVFICFSFTSCLEITERVKHHTNESGEYSLKIDFSQSWLKMKSAIFLEEVDGVKIPNEEEIVEKLTDLKNKASKINGISNVQTTTNFDDYIFIIKLDYQNLKALNDALNIINNQKSQLHFKSNSPTNFERVTSYPIPEKIVNDPKKRSDLEKASSIAIYTLDNEIKSVSNPKSKFSKNKKTVFLKQNLYSVLKNPTLMNNTINLK